MVTIQAPYVHLSWLLLYKFKNSLTVSQTVILSLAISDFISGVSGMVGSYREDLGRVEFSLPIDMAKIMVFIIFVFENLPKFLPEHRAQLDLYVSWVCNDIGNLEPYIIFYPNKDSFQLEFDICKIFGLWVQNWLETQGMNKILYDIIVRLLKLLKIYFLLKNVKFRIWNVPNIGPKIATEW